MVDCSVNDSCHKLGISGPEQGSRLAACDPQVDRVSVHVERRELGERKLERLAGSVVHDPLICNGQASAVRRCPVGPNRDDMAGRRTDAVPNAAAERDANALRAGAEPSVSHLLERVNRGIEQWPLTLLEQQCRLGLEEAASLGETKPNRGAEVRHIIGIDVVAAGSRRRRDDAASGLASTRRGSILRSLADGDSMAIIDRHAIAKP